MTHDEKRKQLAEQIPRSYSGVVHVVAIHLASVGVIIACARQIKVPHWWELAFVPSFFAFANFFEYFVHKGPLHQWLFEVSAVAYYVVYEWFHTWHHVFPGSVVAAHHKAHHDPAQMTKANFNVSFPLADLVLGKRVVARQK